MDVTVSRSVEEVGEVHPIIRLQRRVVLLAPRRLDVVLGWWVGGLVEFIRLVDVNQDTFWL